MRMCGRAAGSALNNIIQNPTLRIVQQMVNKVVVKTSSCVPLSKAITSILMKKIMGDRIKLERFDEVGFDTIHKYFPCGTIPSFVGEGSLYQLKMCDTTNKRADTALGERGIVCLDTKFFIFFERLSCGGDFIPLSLGGVEDGGKKDLTMRGKTVDSLRYALLLCFCLSGVEMVLREGGASFFISCFSSFP